MATRVVRSVAIVFVTVLVGTGALFIYLCASPIAFHELDSSWSGPHQEPTEASATSFRARHKLAVLRAEADHLVHPVRESRIIGLLAASSPDDSGDLFLFFGFRFAPGDIGMH